MKKPALVLSISLLFLAFAAIIFLYKRNAGQAASEALLFDRTDCATLVVDPGHGGADGGALSADGTKESEINLSISLKLLALCRLLGVPAAITRTEETLDYPASLETIRERKVWDQQRRAALVNETPDAVLLSIHQNFYPDPRPHGPQVLYGAVDSSEAFAAAADEALRQALCPESRRLPAPAPENLYLLRSVACTAILVECGFLSNPQECANLRDDTRQTEIAALLLHAYTDFLQMKSAAA